MSMLEIKITIAAPELAVAINNLAAAMVSKAAVSAITLPDGGAVKPAAEKTKKNTKPQEEKPAAPDPEPEEKPGDTPPVPEPEAEKEPEVKYDLTKVREKLAELSKSGKQAQVKALIEKFGASKLSEIKEEQYAALMKEAEAL